MFRLTGSAFLGFFVGIVVPGHTVVMLLKTWSEEDLCDFGTSRLRSGNATASPGTATGVVGPPVIAAACAACAGLSCVILTMVVRLLFGCKVTADAIIMLTVFGGLLNLSHRYVDRLIFCCIHVVSEVVVYVTVNQLSAVAMLDDLMYNAALTIGVLIRVLAGRNPASVILSVCASIVFLAFRRAVARGECVSEGRSWYRKIYRRSRFGYKFESRSRVLTSIAHVIVCTSAVSVASVAMRESLIVPESLIIVYFLSHIRFDYADCGTLFSVAACGCVLISLIVAIRYYLAILVVVGDVAIGLFGCAVRNYVLYKFRWRDVFLGNTACFVSMLLLMVCI
ncbi:GP43 [Caviid betaherpesvirus 2]|uniref:GP43 n=1 Tax=Guinea pig cytomegalovirus (strain 22122) TaxID=103920 RepID=B7TPW2_GPCMV|nr:GP43 [Caviid betaherpesvirus 2]AGE11520.1 GP43 [Caviid betaherpesvirus 2]AIL83908.1 GP43 [BAC cloning vector GPN13BACdenovo_preserved(MM)]BAJ78510.1 GP43 [Caviid betaherpesvirus 2]